MRRIDSDSLASEKFANSKKLNFRQNFGNFFLKIGRVVFTKFSGFVGGWVPVRENLKIGGQTPNLGVAEGQTLQ